MSFTFYGASFEYVIQDRRSCFWRPDIETTDRKLAGTSYVERNWRHTTWVFDGLAWIPGSDTAEQAFLALQYAYQHALPSDWSDGVVVHTAIIQDFEMVPLYSGYDGYQGRLAFVRPYG